MSDFNRNNSDHRPRGPQLKQADKDFYRQQEEARKPKPRKEMPLYAANMDEQNRDMRKADRRGNLARKHHDAKWWHERDARRKEKNND